MCQGAIGCFVSVWMLLISGSLQASLQPPTHTTVAFGSCAHQEKPQPIWKAIVQREPSLIIFLGDNVYAGDVSFKQRQEAYARLAIKPGFQELRSSAEILGVWDDNDFAWPDGGGDYPHKEKSRRALLEFLKEPLTSARWKNPGIYQSALYGPKGQQFQVILLDTRFNRSPLIKKGGRYVPHPRKSATMLGKQQWKWLRRVLKEPVELRLVISSIQVLATNHRFEKWSNLPFERKRLLDLLTRKPAPPTIILSGDRHHASVYSVKYNNKNLWEVTSSSLSHTIVPSPENDPLRIGPLITENNFGVISFDSPSARVFIDLIGEKNQVLRSHTLQLPNLEEIPQPSKIEDSIKTI